MFNGAPPGAIESLLPGQARISEIYLGLRVGMAGGLTINSECTSGTGGGTVQKIDSRAVHCLLEDGNECPTSASQFTDEQLPVYHPLNVGDVPPDRVGDFLTGYPIDDTSVSDGPVFNGVRLGDLSGTFTCADVVAAFN